LDYDNPNMKYFYNIENGYNNKISNGTNMTINDAIIINGPNGIYSSLFFFLETSKIILITAPNKNAISEKQLG